MALPEPLRQAVAEAAAALPARELTTLSATLTAAYRGGLPPVHLPPAMATAYAAVRLPATFAATHAALAHARAALPGWAPRSLLDVGAGPGTATWAAASVWPSLERATLLEREPAMIALGKQLGSPLPQATWMQRDLAAPWAPEPHDLVIASYVVGEAAGLTDRLWAAAAGLLVIVEPGTPAGFERVRAARAQLVAAGARIAAPCPHDGVCPMAGGDWCHFAERVERSSAHRRAKGGDLGHEDEKYSYVAAARVPVAPSHGRILRHPQVRKGHVVLEACTPTGLQRLTLARSDGQRYRVARDLGWGSSLP